MPAPLLSREEVIDRLFVVFRDQGYDGASLAALSKATGLGRSSLYHHFPGGKDDMAAAVMTRAQAWLEINVVAMAHRKISPKARLEQIAASLTHLYAGGANGCVLANLGRETIAPPVRAQVKQAFATWVDALADVAIEAGVPEAAARSRAFDVVAGLQGALVMAAGAGDTAGVRRLLERLPRDLLAD